MYLVPNIFPLLIIALVIDEFLCDWVEIPQVTTNRHRDQNFYRSSTTTSTTVTPVENVHRHYTIDTNRNFPKNSYGNFETNTFGQDKRVDNDASRTQIGRPEVTTERHWSETTINLEDLVNDALYNLKNPISPTTEKSSKITTFTTTEIPPPLPAVTPTIATTRQEESGLDVGDDNGFDEYYDDVYVTTALDDSDELQSSQVASDFNKISSTKGEATSNRDSVDGATYKQETKESGQIEQKNNDNGSSLFSMAGFLPLLKDIQATLTKNKQRTTSGKIALLENIRNQLLTNINYRINELWGGDDNVVGDGRNKRKSTVIRERRDARTFKDKEHQDDPHDHHFEEHEYDHHVDFPSNAAALLALSFLTFAVFLIKLVLQVIHALKAKAQNMTTTTTSATIIRLRRSQDEEYENAARILHYIDTYSIK